MSSVSLSASSIHILICSLMFAENSFGLLLTTLRDLSYNQLTGEIPFDIGFLQVATLLESSSFFLCPICGEFFVFVSLTRSFGFYLLFRSLQGNQLSGKIPSVIGLMQALAVLLVLFPSNQESYSSNISI